MKLGDPKVQEQWLVQDIPHRLRAVLANTAELKLSLEKLSVPPELQMKMAAFCVEMAMWEGRHSAVRWLIEFVGVSADGDAKATKSRRRKARESAKANRRFEDDVDIMDLPGGEYFDLESPDAILLGEVSHACSKATGHPTFGSGHKSLDHQRLVKAALVVGGHLKRTVYAKAEKDEVALF